MNPDVSVLDMFDDNMSFLAFTRLSFDSVNLSSSRFLSLLVFTRASSFSFFPPSMTTCATVRQITNISQFCSLSPRIGARLRGQERPIDKRINRRWWKKKRQQQEKILQVTYFHQWCTVILLLLLNRVCFASIWRPQHGLRSTAAGLIIKRKPLVIDRRRYSWSNSQESQTMPLSRSSRLDYSRLLMSTASSRNEAPSLPGVDCFFSRIARIAESFS